MHSPPNSPDEEFRIQALRQLQILDTEPDFDAIVNLGRIIFNVPICLISLVDNHRQWFKARTGLDALETPRDVSFCGHAILQPDVFVVLDAGDDERFHDNPLVTGPPDIRFYVGAPLRLPNGYAIGTLCLISPTPREEFGADDVEKLQQLSDLALDAIAVRALRLELDRERQFWDRLQMLFELSNEAIAFSDGAGVIQECNVPFAKMCGRDVPISQTQDDALAITINDVLEIPELDWSPQKMIATGLFETTVRAPGLDR